MGRIVGIDLGTTNSVVATLDMGGCKILPNKENEQQTRSIVGLRKGEFLIGSTAMRYWPMAAEDTVVSIKRLMGRAISDPEVENIKQEEWYEIVEPSDGTKDSLRVKLGGKEYSPVEISVKIVSKLKRDAEFVLGEEVTHAVITVPAYFSEKQRHATRDAGLKAGLTVMKLLDEPTAAAISFGIDLKAEEAKIILVYDLGGGTFDISVLMMAAGSFAPLQLEGDMWLGGDNFDQLIVNYIVDQVKKNYGIDPTKNKRFMVTLKMEAQKTKETLSAARTADLIVPGILQDGSGNIIDVDIEITRDHFEKMIEPLVERTVVLAKKAVEGAGFTPEDIDFVIMAGNSTAVPKVQEAMEKLFGREKVSRKVHPKNSVAMGAAMTAAIYSSVNCPKCDHNNNLDSEKCEKCGTTIIGTIEKKRCPSCGTENNQEAESCENCGSPFIEIESVKGGIAPFHYGIQTAGDKFNIFINKGDEFETPEDMRQVQTFHTRFPNQRIISVPVYGGENLEYASKNVKQGEVYAVLPPELPEETPIKAKLWLDKDGAFIVDTFLDDGTDLEDLFLRGEADQKAIETLIKAEEMLAGKKDMLSPDEKTRVGAIRENALGKMNKKDFKGAEKEAEDFMKSMAVAGMGDDPLRTRAEGLMNFGNFIVNTYGWLISQSVYRLNNLIAELSQPLNKNDRNLMESKVTELGKTLDDLLQTKDPTGKPVPTLLGIFLGIHGAIASVIQPVDPAEAGSLKEELTSIEKAFKDNQPDAMTRLNGFMIKLNSAIEKAQKLRPEGIPCPSCGHRNPVGIRNCKNCGADLWLLGQKG